MILSWIDWVVIGAYASGMVAVGWYFSRKTTSTEDYLLGGRNMKSWSVGLSLFASLLSTVSYLAWPGEIIKYGPIMLGGICSLPFTIIVVGWLIIPFIMRLKVTSAYELLEIRLGLGVRMLGATFFLSMRLFWMALVIYATVDKVLVPLAGWDPSVAPYAGAAMGLLTVLYTSMGGLRAVVWTDVVQTIILFGGAIFTLAIITGEMGGVSAWWPTQWDPQWQKPAWFHAPEASRTIFAASLAGFTWWVCTSGSDQMAIQRYLATRNAKAARRAFIISLATDLTVTFALSVLGFALLAYYKTHPQWLTTGDSITAQADQLFPMFIARGLPVGVSGLVVAGLLAAAMSSLSSGLNSSCSVITVDFIDRFRAKQLAEREHVALTRYVSATVGIIVVFISTLLGVIKGNLLEVAFKTVNLLVAPLFGLFFMAMFVPWATAFGTFVGAAAGLATVVAVNYWEQIVGSPGISFLWAMPLGLVIQIAVGVIASIAPVGRRASEEAVVPDA